MKASPVEVQLCESGSERPMRITIIAWLFIVVGGLTLYGMVTQLARFEFKFSAAVCMLPVGIGLLRGNPNSLWWAKFWMVIGYFQIALFVVLSIVNLLTLDPNDIRSVDRAGSAPFVLLVSCGFAAIFYTIHRLLYSSRSEKYFNPDITSESN